MTCICVDKLKNGKFIMMGDRRVTGPDGAPGTDPAPKINLVGNSLVATAGDSHAAHYFLSQKSLKLLDKASDPFKFISKVVIPGFKQDISENQAIDKLPDDEPNPFSHDGEYLIVTQGKIWWICFNSKMPTLIEERLHPAGIGCGWPIAQTALHTIRHLLTEKRDIKAELRMAMSIAAELNIYCDNNIDVLIGGN